jgi:hypothetical protein
MTETLRTNGWLFQNEMFGVCQRRASGIELLRSQADVRVPPKAAWEDSCGFDRRRVAQTRQREQRPDRQRQRSRSGSFSGSPTTSTSAKMFCQPDA